MKEINVLSLFDGMSCGQIVLDRLGIPVNRYLASEIDKHAIEVTRHNYPFTEHIGSVVDVKAEDLPEIDLLIGGSPCQGFSFAGKQLNFDDPRSKLFFEFVRLLTDLMPKYFLLENVKMKKKYQDIITSYMGVEPIEINSSLVSAQNRKRLYWTNIPFDEMPENKKLTIEDVIDTEGPYKYLIDTSYAKLKTRVTGINRLDYLEANYVKNYDTFDSCKLAAVIENDTPSKISRQGDRVYSIKGKMPCLTTSTSPKIDAGSPCSMDWRLLTRKEMERGQTVPEGYTTPVSYAAASCMLGNGWTVDVICHLFKNMKF